MEDDAEDKILTVKVDRGVQDEPNKHKFIVTPRRSKAATFTMLRSEALMTLIVVIRSDVAEVRNKCKMLACNYDPENGVIGSYSQGKKVKIFVKIHQMHIIC